MAHLEKLHTLMAGSGVTVSDVQNAIAARGYFPASTPVDKYPAEFVDELCATWPQVLAPINDQEAAS